MTGAQGPRGPAGPQGATGTDGGTGPPGGTGPQGSLGNVLLPQNYIYIASDTCLNTLSTLVALNLVHFIGTSCPSETMNCLSFVLSFAWQIYIRLHRYRISRISVVIERPHDATNHCKLCNI